MIGGSGSLNSMLYARGGYKDFDDWARMGNPTWSWQEVLDYFKKSEDMLEPKLLKNGFHETSGLWKVQYVSKANTTINQKILEVIKELHGKEISDFNTGNHVGFSKMLGNIYNGERYSTAKSFLIPASTRSNLHVIKNAIVTKIEFDNDKAVGVQFEIEHNGRDSRMIARNKKDIVISGGTFGSPLLLQISGVGPKSLLKRLDINLIHELPVGENFHDHVSVPIFVSHQLSKLKPTDDIQKAQELYDYLTKKSGPYAGIGEIDISGFVNVLNSKSSHPNIQYAMKNYAPQANDLKRDLEIMGYSQEVIKSITDANNEAQVMLIGVTLLSTESRGSVQARGANPHISAKIYSGFLDNEASLDTVLKGIKLARKALQTNTLKSVEGADVKVSLHECDSMAYDSNEYWICYIKQMSHSPFHPVGTCKMGVDASAVVDPRLRVHGVQRLRVIDASIMPKIVTANIAATTVMIGEKGADFIKEDWGVKEKPVTRGKVPIASGCSTLGLVFRYLTLDFVVIVVTLLK